MQSTSKARLPPLQQNQVVAPYRLLQDHRVEKHEEANEELQPWIEKDGHMLF